jgi:acetyltransferase
VADTATGLVPLDDVLAADLIGRTRVSRLLAGYRDRKPANRAAIVDTLIAVSQLSIDLPMIVGLDINPLVADSDGVIALDARVEIDPARMAIAAPNPALAIRPYPSSESKLVSFGTGSLLLRPIKPSDTALYPGFLKRVTADDMRLRFLVPTDELSEATLIRLTQLDYDRDIAFVALEQPSGELAGIVRYASSPDRDTAEFGILVRSDLKGRGLGRTLMETLIDYGMRQGINQLTGSVLRENVGMLGLADAFGFVQGASDDPRLVEIALKLGR